MEGRNRVFLNKEDIWRVCLFCKVWNYDKGDDAKSIIIQQDNIYLDKQYTISVRKIIIVQQSTP